jgi:GPH family glycoside/pentoside/hexuronide:cation symporter
MSDVRELTRSQQLGWAAGAMGTGMMIGSVSSYALFIMTNVLGIGAATAGLIIGLSKFYDVVIDPLIGRVSDRLDHRWGRRRPFLLVGLIIAPLAFIALFNAPVFEAPSFTIAYMVVVLLLIATGTSLFMVPYMAMAAEMTSSTNERTVLMSQRVFFNTLGLLAMSVALPAVISAFGGRPHGYGPAGVVMASVVVVSFATTFYLTRSAKFLPRTTGKPYTFTDQLRFIAGNKSFACFIAAKICTFLAQSSLQTTLLLYGVHILARDERFLAPFGIGYTVGSLAALPFWSWLMTRKVSKRTAYNISVLGLGLVFLTWLVATPGEPTWVATIRFLLVGALSAGSMTAGTSMLPDMMELDRRTTGVRQEGLYAAAYTLVENVGSTIGPVLVGFALGFTGFISSTGAATVAQPPAALLAISLCVSVVPAVFMSAAALLMRGYTVDDELRRLAAPSSPG